MWINSSTVIVEIYISINISLRTIQITPAVKPTPNGDALSGGRNNTFPWTLKQYKETEAHTILPLLFISSVSTNPKQQGISNATECYEKEHVKTRTVSNTLDMPRMKEPAADMLLCN